MHARSLLLLLVLPLLGLTTACLDVTELDPPAEQEPDDGPESSLPFLPDPDASPDEEPAAAPEGEPAPDAGGGEPAPSPDAEPEGPIEGGVCEYWSDCPAGDDDNSGYECVDGACVCDPNDQYRDNCVALGGIWSGPDCMCDFPGDGVGGSCQQWQDCGPFTDNYQTGFDCVSGTCVCDPNGQYQTGCAQQGGSWVSGDCACSFAGAPPSSSAVPEGWIWDVEPECWWHLVEPVCDPDMWVDTSYYRDECYYDANDNYICNSVYVPDGHWRDGACPAPYWEPWCISVGTARWGVTG